MDRCSQISRVLVTKTIANQYPRGGIATFRKPVALTFTFEASFFHATSQNPQDSRIYCGMIQDGKLRGFAMGHAIPVRTDYTAGEVRRLAQRAKDAAQARRLLAIAAVLDGAS